MYCIKCGTKNKEDVKFCKECGNPMKKIDIYYAGFWVRFGAYFADFLGVVVLALIIGMTETIFGIPEIISKIGIFGDYLVWIIYSTLFLTIWSATPGKMIYGLKILKEKNDERLDFGTAVGRAVLQPLSLLFFGAGYWNMGKNDKEQTWHDKQVHTVVVGDKKKNYIFPIILSIIGLCLYAYLRSLSSGQ